MGRYAPFIEPERFARVVGAPFLIAARLQPAYSNWPQAWLDLVFLRDGDVALAPFVQIDPAMISVRESSPLIWPSWLPLEAQTAAALEEFVEPWLLSHALLGGISREAIGHFSEEPQARELFDAAREARFLCAAPVDAVLTDAAPYVYAQRFVKSRRVSIRSSAGALGASLLADSAASVHADLGDSRLNELARSWYGLGIYGELPHAAFDVAISPSAAIDALVSISLEEAERGATLVKVARPLFPSLPCSFDVDDGPETRRFTVRARDPILRASRVAPAPVIGGSAGRILVVIRDNGLTVQDADTDQARALVDALVVQGFDAELKPASAARTEGVDLVHLFGHRHVHQFGPVLEAAERLGIPVVTTPLFDDFASEALWGSTIVRTMLTSVRDNQLQQSLENGMVSRRLLVSASIERGKPSYDTALVRRMLAQSAASLFSSVEEEAWARSQFAFKGASRVVPCVLPRPIATEAIGALSGLDEYVLVHTTIEPRGNQFLAVRAAAAAGIPCVLMGTVVEVDYYYAVLAVGGREQICLAEDALSAGQVEALYAGARLYADLSWAGYGAHRAVRAAAYGALPVLSTALPLAQLWPELTGGVDPASLESATAVLRGAWMRAPALTHQIADRTAQACDPLRSLQGVLGAYAEAASVKAV